MSWRSGSKRRGTSTASRSWALYAFFKRRDCASRVSKSLDQLASESSTEGDWQRFQNKQIEAANQAMSDSVHHSGLRQAIVEAYLG